MKNWLHTWLVYCQHMGLWLAYAVFLSSVLDEVCMLMLTEQALIACY